MFGISTAWKSPEIKDGNQLIDELEKTGIPGIEIDYRINSTAFQQIVKRLKNSSLKVLSLHNYCPHPDILPPEKASGDAFWLSAIDEDERKLAIQYSLRTIHNADRIGAKAVVVHAGKIGMERESERWFDLFNRGGFQDSEGQEFVKRKMKERAKAKQPFFDALFKSLEQLNQEAMRLNILIGIENRNYLNDLPNFDEIGNILDFFKGGKIGYWHDVGHAQAIEAFGFCQHERFLQAYASQLVGIHLHDAHDIGYNDHFAPGSGLINFDMVKKYLTKNTIKIIEAHPKVTADELEQSIRFLKEKEIV